MCLFHDGLLSLESCLNYLPWIFMGYITYIIRDRLKICTLTLENMFSGFVTRYSHYETSQDRRSWQADFPAVWQELPCHRTDCPVKPVPKSYCFWRNICHKILCFNQPIKSHIGKWRLGAINILFTELSWMFCGHWSIYIILHSNLKTYITYFFLFFVVCSHVMMSVWRNCGRSGRLLQSNRPAVL